MGVPLKFLTPLHVGYATKPKFATDLHCSGFGRNALMNHEREVVGISVQRLLTY